jgi:hypothetical protein
VRRFNLWLLLLLSAVLTSAAGLTYLQRLRPAPECHPVWLTFKNQRGSATIRLNMDGSWSIGSWDDVRFMARETKPLTGGFACIAEWLLAHRDEVRINEQADNRCNVPHLRNSDILYEWAKQVSPPVRLCAPLMQNNLPIGDA